jgi:hypothetical protein
MNRFAILLCILLFASFAASIPLKREDSLKGFKECDGKFPNTITSLTYSPDPVYVGHIVNIHIAGKSTATVEKNAFVDISGYFLNNDTLLFRYTFDYCKLFVNPSGSECPVEKGHFDFTANWVIPNEYDSEPKYVDEFVTKMTSMYFLKNISLLFAIYNIFR